LYFSKTRVIENFHFLKEYVGICAAFILLGVLAHECSQKGPKRPSPPPPVNSHFLKIPEIISERGEARPQGYTWNCGVVDWCIHTKKGREFGGTGVIFQKESPNMFHAG